RGDAALCRGVCRSADEWLDFAWGEERCHVMSMKPSQSLSLELKPFVAPFRFDGSGKFRLGSHKTNGKGGLDKDKAEKIIEANRKRLSDFQEKLYAQNRWS